VIIEREFELNMHKALNFSCLLSLFKNCLTTGSALKLNTHHAFHDLIDNFAQIAKSLV
jgi:hypothetical protein